MARGNEPTAREIAQLLNGDATNLVSAILPNAKFYGGMAHIGSVQGEPGSSMKVYLQGDKQGGWSDYSLAISHPEAKGDMLRLVQLVMAQGDLAGAVRWAKGWLGLDTMDRGSLQKVRDHAAARAQKQQKKSAADTEKKRLNAVNLWKASQLLKDSPAEKYLRGRLQGAGPYSGFSFDSLGYYPGAIRFHPQIWNSELERKIPAMITIYSGANAGQSGAHITYLAYERGNWVKEPRIEDKKKTWGPSYWSGHISLCKGGTGKRLCEVAPETPIYCSEGIEDGLSIAALDPARYVVAGGTLGNIGAMILPPQAGDFIIIGQSDAMHSKADQSLETQIGNQQEQAERHASENSGVCRRVKILWPDPAYKDFNDQLRDQKRGCA